MDIQHIPNNVQISIAKKSPKEMRCNCSSSRLWTVAWLTIVFFFFVFEVSSLSKGSVTFIIRKLSNYIYISEKKEKMPMRTQRYQASIWLFYLRCLSCLSRVLGLPGDVPPDSCHVPLWCCGSAGRLSPPLLWVSVGEGCDCHRRPHRNSFHRW